MKVLKWALVPVLGIIAAFILWYEPFYESCEQIRGGALRLHVIANSDSEADQTVKLEVRDAVLAATGDSFLAADSRDGAIAAADAAMDAIENAANAVLRENGFDYTARAYLTDTYFDSRTYGDATLPAGEYTALRVELGKAEGHNWWCVMYPPLCVMSSTGEADAKVEEAFGDDAVVVLGGKKYAVKFKLEEWFQKWRRESTEQ